MMQFRAALAVTGALMMATPAAADEWPSRPVRMVNTFAAGGTADVLTRLVADQLSATFKQQFFVETRAGAAGTIGVKSVADSAPDGYNFALTNITHLVLAPISNPKLGYDPKRDLTNIGYVAGSPIVLSVSANGSIKTLQDFIEQGRAGKAADLFLVRRRQFGTTGGGGFRQEGRHQDRARALQGRFAGPDRSGRRPYRVLGADHVVHRGAGARRPASRDRAFERHPHAGLPGCADAEGIRLRRRRHHLVHASPVRPTCRRTSPRRSTARSPAPSPIPEAQARLQRDGLIAHIMSVEELSKYIDAETARWRPVLDQLGLIGK